MTTQLCQIFVWICVLGWTQGYSYNSSEGTARQLLSDWTIIGYSRVVSNLGASVNIAGDAIGLSQSNGVYISAFNDKRLFTQGTDKTFIPVTRTNNMPVVAVAASPAQHSGCTTCSNIQSISAVGGENKLGFAVLRNNVWIQKSSSVKETYTISGGDVGVASLGRAVAVVDGTVVASGYSTADSNIGAVALFRSSNLAAAKPTWQKVGSNLEGGSSSSFGTTLAMIADRAGSCNINGHYPTIQGGGDSRRRGVPVDSRRRGAHPISANWDCRVLVGEPSVSKVHIYTIGGTGNVWVLEQTLEGYSDFGRAISATRHTGVEMILIGAPAAGNAGRVFIYEWSAVSGSYTQGGILYPVPNQSPWTTAIGSGSLFGFSLDHIERNDGSEQVVIVGAPGTSNAFVYRASATPGFFPAGPNRTFTYSGVINGKSRLNHQTYAPSDEMGYSVAIGESFLYVGIPKFNEAKKYQHSAGAIQVLAYCPANYFVNVQARLGQINLGARCDRCPGQATSPGGQTMVCDNCGSIPTVLPQGAKVTSGCSISCGSLYVYQSSSNTCIYHANAATRNSHPASSDPRSDAISMSVGIIVCGCLLCFCCYAFKGPLHPSNILGTRVGLAQAPQPAQANLQRIRPGVQPIGQVVLSKYPVSEIIEGAQVPVHGDCCVVCIEEFKLGDRIRTLSCDHTFHQSCIDSWLATHTTCPLCNLALETEIIDPAPRPLAIRPPPRRSFMAAT